MGQQQPHAWQQLPQLLEQNRRGAGFAQRHGVHPDEAGGRIRAVERRQAVHGLRIAPEALFHRMGVTGFRAGPSRQLAPQQRLCSPENNRIQRARQVHRSDCRRVLSTPNRRALHPSDGRGAGHASTRRGTGFARPLAWSPFPRAAREKQEDAKRLRGMHLSVPRRPPGRRASRAPAAPAWRPRCDAALQACGLQSAAPAPAWCCSRGSDRSRPASPRAGRRWC